MQRVLQETLQQRLLRSPSLWFVPKQHVWLQCSRCSIPLSAVSTRGTVDAHYDTPSTPLWRVKWGMTAHGMDRLGDITKLTCFVDDDKSNQEVPSVVQQGQDLFRVHWEGYEWTEADELYHTVWDSVEGEECITSPVTGKLIHVVNSEESVVDEEISWAEMECKDHDLLQAAANWVDEGSYNRWINRLAPSKFSDRMV